MTGAAIRRAARATVLLTLTVVLLAAAGCRRSNGAASADQAEISRQEAMQRLQGRWLLSGFRPEQPLEPMLGSLLAAQMGRMQLTIDGQRMLVQGIGVQTERTYQVQSAAGDGATLILYDPSGVSYEVDVRFMGPRLDFVAKTPPWRGTGTLQRAQ